MEPTEDKSSYRIGCGIASAIWFAIFGIAWPFAHILGGTFEGGEMSLFPLMIGGPAFLLSHFFAFSCISESDRRIKGYLILGIVWGSIASMFIVGFIVDFIKGQF